MTRIMRDSTTPNAIPLGGTDIAAGYDDGTYKDIAQLVARFPHIPIVQIDVNGSTPKAHVRDWETGDKVGSLHDWVVEHNQQTGRKDAVVYCNRSTIAEVRQLTGDQILNKDYFLWVATLDGTMYGPDKLAGVIACQDKGAAQVGANYDESVVWADWFPGGKVTQPTNTSDATQSGVVVSVDSHGIAKVTSTDGGQHWWYGGSAASTMLFQRGYVVSYTTQRWAHVVTRDGGLTWTYTPGGWPSSLSFRYRKMRRTR